MTAQSISQTTSSDWIAQKPASGGRRHHYATKLPADELARKPRKFISVESNWDVRDQESLTEKLNPSTPRALPWEPARGPRKFISVESNCDRGELNPLQKNSTPPLPDPSHGSRQVSTQYRTTPPFQLPETPLPLFCLFVN